MRALILMAALVPTAAVPPAGPRPVAIVYRLEGSARLAAAADQPFFPLKEPWRRLAPGTILETSAASTVSVVFWSGRRYVLEPGSRARVAPLELRGDKGTVRSLPQLPAGIRLAPLLGPDASWRTGAVAIRGPEGGKPPDVPALLAGAAGLCLTPAAGAEPRRVEILDGRDRLVYRSDTSAVRLWVPAGVLRTGHLYRFRTRAAATPGAGWRVGLFTTVPRGQERLRAALEEAADRTGDADLQLLLERVDEELGVRRGDCGLALPDGTRRDHD